MAKAAHGTDAGTEVTRLEQPIILIRGFGGLGVEDEKRIAYQGFNDGTVYPQKTGENYIYEGLILRFMKSRWTYHDATNVVGYYGEPNHPRAEGASRTSWRISILDLFSGDKIVIDPAMAVQLLSLHHDRLLNAMGLPLLRSRRPRRFEATARRLCASSTSSGRWRSSNTRR